ncbi:MAG: thiamine diphosphokinase [Acidimicrobiales bacterium]
MFEVLPATDDLVAVALVFAGGDSPSQAQYEAIVGPLTGTVRVIAADSGADHARALGVHVDVAVGDFDSASDLTQAWLHQIGSDIREFGPHKNYSDLELALAAATEDDPTAIYVLGLGGGRLDHSLLNLLVLADARWSTSQIHGLSNEYWISVIHDEIMLTGELGSLVSLIPIGGPASVSTTGLLYALDGEELSPTGARGLSNVLAGVPARVHVEAGVVLAVQAIDGGGNHV